MIHAKVIQYDPSDHYNGIFKYLSEETGQEDLLTSKIIEFNVSSESNIPDHSDLGFVLGYNNSRHKNYYITGTEHQNAWFEVDFKQNRIIPYGYFYKAHSKDFFDQFELLGSINQKNWFELDSRNNSEFINLNESEHGLQEKYFECNKNFYRTFRYLRIQTHGNRTYQGYGIAIFGLEFYGKIQPFINISQITQINSICITFFTIFIHRKC